MNQEECDHIHYTLTGKTEFKSDSNETRFYKEVKCDDCKKLFYEEYTYHGIVMEMR